MIKKDFKQKYFLFCREIKTEKITLEKLAQIDTKPYIRKIIEIKYL